MGQRAVLIVNPRDDEAFGDLVEGFVAAGAETTAALQAALRHAGYTRATVHPREISAEPVVVWYVYREGRWIRPGGAARG